MSDQSQRPAGEKQTAGEGGLLGKRISLADDLPEPSQMDFYSTPLTDFGEKMLKMMAKADPGKAADARRPAQPIQFNPRPENLGLGAIPKKEIIDKIRSGQTVTDKDLRSKAFRSVSYIGQDASEDPDGLKFGDQVVVTDGKYDQLRGLLVEVDREDDRYCIVQLSINKKNARVLCKNLRKLEQPGAEQPAGREREEQREKKKKRLKWVLPGIRLQIVSQSYREGRYFEERGTVEDVLDEKSFTFVTQKGEILEDLEEKQLETVMPRLGEKVMILKGCHRGVVGVLHEVSRRENRATVKIEVQAIEFVSLQLDDCSAV